MALDDNGKQKDRASGGTLSRTSALRSLAERAAAAEAQKKAQARPQAVKAPPEAASAPQGVQGQSAAKQPDRARASLVRSMMENIDQGAKKRPPQSPPRMSPEPPRRAKRESPVTLPPKSKSADFDAVFDKEPSDRVERARLAAQRVRLRARDVTSEPAARQPSDDYKRLAGAEPSQKNRTAKSDPVLSGGGLRPSAGTARPVTRPPAQPVAQRAAAALPMEAPAPSTPRSITVGKPKPVRIAKTRMFAGFEWDIAFRYLRARRKEGFISVIAGFSLVGIALGVATLIIVMAVMTGFRETLVEQIIGVNPHVNVVSQQEKFDNFDPLAEAIRQVDGIERVAPSIEGQVLASSASGHSGVIVRGMRRDDFSKLKLVTAPEESVGSLENFRRDKGIAIGEGVARKLNLRLGDGLTLISPDGDLTPFGVTPRSKSYPVTYIFKLGLSQYDSAYVYMPLEEAQLYFNKKGVVDSLDVTVAEPNDVEQYTQPIRQAANSSVGVYTWKDFQGSLIGALDVERNVMFLILTLIILVAALNIISGLVMLVKDKARDVAIMRTMGMSRGAILRIFFICGSSIGVVGSIIGAVLGVLFCLNIGAIQGVVESICGCQVFPQDVYGLSGLPSKLEFSDVLLTLGIALTLSFLATLYPAWKAANLDPVEALRYE